MADFNVYELAKESDIENKFVTWAVSKGLMAIKLNISGRRGLPDRLILGHNGKALFIEFKKPNAKATKLQIYMHKMLADRGFKVFVLESFEDAEHICERHLL